MMIKKLIILSAILLSFTSRGQDEDKVLFSIEETDVYSTEFIRVYEKNRDLVVEDERKGFDDYFDLFVDFKLKLRQARDQKLDTSTTYKSELSKYREQLVQPYLQDPEATEALVRQAYDRTVEEVNASHILIRIEPDASDADTLKAYSRILEASHKILEGSSFDSIAKMYSEDPSVAINGGDLGYFSAFSMVYNFENAAYETPVDSISEPFRTQFGYHIVKVNDRRKSPGEVKVAHIMVKKDSANPNLAEEKILDIYRKLEQGDDFATIAKEHSDDLSSAQKGGELPKFGTGRMIKSFEDVAFSLQNTGDFSKPFETEYGWHILELLQKYPVGTYEELHTKLESRVKSGSRSGYVKKALAQKIAADYKVVTFKAKVHLQPVLAEFENSSDTLLIIMDQTYTGRDFYEFEKDLKNKTRDELYSEFVNSMIIDYYKDHLDETNKDFARTYQEYEDGLLLFELLQKKVWERSEKDTAGLINYFESNRSKYNWGRRGEVVIASCTNFEKAQVVKSMLTENQPLDTIKEKVNEGATIHVLFSKGKLEEGSSKLPEDYILKLGVSDIYETEPFNFTIIKTDAIFEPERKELKETRGEVMNDYQNYLEQEWVTELHKTYTVRVNQKNYKELKKRLSTE